MPAAQVERKAVSLKNAKSIGLMFDATLIEEREAVLKFAKTLKTNDHKVKLLGFFNKKLESDSFPFPHFDKKKLDFALRPKTAEIEEFTAHPFDLLINISKRPTLPLDYIAAHSKAKFRVGPFTENTFCYDLLIEHDGKKGLDSFIAQLTHYLGKIGVAA